MADEITRSDVFVMYSLFMADDVRISARGNAVGDVLRVLLSRPLVDPEQRRVAELAGRQGLTVRPVRNPGQIPVSDALDLEIGDGASDRETHAATKSRVEQLAQILKALNAERREREGEQQAEHRELGRQRAIERGFDEWLREQE